MSLKATKTELWRHVSAVGTGNQQHDVDTLTGYFHFPRSPARLFFLDYACERERNSTKEGKDAYIGISLENFKIQAQ